MLADKNLIPAHRLVAIQRLTALWAFAESGLGGILHALHVPFTGLVVGGMAIIIICLVAEISKGDLKQVLKSAIIVLIIKAMVSPYTPFPAYIAVGFQAVLGYALFSLLRVNMLSILLLSVIAMMESAIQKLLILTLFFGKSFWTAADSLFEFIFKQFGVASHNGSEIIIAAYLLIYLAGGIIVALMAKKAIGGFYAKENTYSFKAENGLGFSVKSKTPARTKQFRKLASVFVILIGLSAILFAFSSNAQQGWITVIRTFTWTISVMILWYVIIGPVFTQFIRRYLQKKEGRYSDEVFNALSFLPILRQLTVLAWEQSRQQKGKLKWISFFSTFIHWSLTYAEVPDVPGKPTP